MSSGGSVSLQGSLAGEDGPIPTPSISNHCCLQSSIYLFILPDNERIFTSLGAFYSRGGVCADRSPGLADLHHVRRSRNSSIGDLHHCAPRQRGFRRVFEVRGDIYVSPGVRRYLQFQAPAVSQYAARIREAAEENRRSEREDDAGTESTIELLPE
ncbi:hypothetical protein ES703_109166 [subsurface metagenome]